MNAVACQNRGKSLLNRLASLAHCLSIPPMENRKLTVVRRSLSTHEYYSHLARPAFAARNHFVVRRAQFRLALPTRHICLACGLRTRRRLQAGGGDPAASALQPYGRSLARACFRAAKWVSLWLAHRWSD